jgi:hypothetical protein
VSAASGPAVTNDKKRESFARGVENSTLKVGRVATSGWRLENPSTTSAGFDDVEWRGSGSRRVF